jgi:TonB family protein
MDGSLNLKIFLSISLGLHLLFFSVSSLLFPDFKVNGLRNLNLEVSLLPLISETKTLTKGLTNHESRLRAPSFEARLLRRTSETPDSGVQARVTSRPGKMLLHQEKKEDPLINKEKKPDSLPVQDEVKVIPASHPSALILENEKWEMGDNKEEKGILESYRNPLPATGSLGQPKVSMKSPSLSDGEILFVQPQYAENPKPIYPQEARRKGYEGEVILRVEVLPNGRVGQIEVKNSSGHELLDRSAFATVKQWKFVPAKKGEKTIPLWVNIPVKFQLQ